MTDKIQVPLPVPQMKGEGYVIQPWEKDTVSIPQQSVGDLK